MLSTVSHLPVEAMTDVEALQAYLELSENRELVAKQLEQERVDLRVSLLNQTNLNHVGMQAVLSKYDSMVASMMPEMVRLAAEEAKKYLTTDELKVWIEFLREHPDLYRKTQEYQMSTVAKVVLLRNAFQAELNAFIESTHHLRRNRNN